MVTRFWSPVFGKKAGKHPWQAITLEWTTLPQPSTTAASPYPTVSHGPDEDSVPGRVQGWLPETDPAEARKD